MQHRVHPHHHLPHRLGAAVATALMFAAMVGIAALGVLGFSLLFR